MSIIRNKIITLLSDYPERDFYNQEIADIAECSKASASLILNKLLTEKIIISNARGNLKFYKINTRSIEVKQFRINQTIEQLKEIVNRLSKYSEKIILFGSMSRGEQTMQSDIDLMIISREHALASEILKKARFKHKINAIIKTQSEFSELEVKNPEFYYEVKNGIILHQHDTRI